MKKIYTSNQELLDVLTNHGINIVCNEKMEMTVSDEDAKRIEEIVSKYAPAAASDFCLEGEINTLQELADFINDNEDWQIETERIIEENGWESDCGSEYGICHSGNDYVEFNSNGEAVVISRDE